MILSVSFLLIPHPCIQCYVSPLLLLFKLNQMLLFYAKAFFQPVTHERVTGFWTIAMLFIDIKIIARITGKQHPSTKTTLRKWESVG